VAYRMFLSEIRVLVPVAFMTHLLAYHEYTSRCARDVMCLTFERDMNHFSGMALLLAYFQKPGRLQLGRLMQRRGLQSEGSPCM
jgi:hypothetical protein